MNAHSMIYVPGTWCCPKCTFVLVQSNLNAADGTITARDEPGDRCPNCDSPLWRVSWKDQAKEMGARAEQEILRSQETKQRFDFLVGEVEKALACFDRMPLQQYFDRVDGGDPIALAVRNAFDHLSPALNVLGIAQPTSSARPASSDS